MVESGSNITKQNQIPKQFGSKRTSYPLNIFRVVVSVDIHPFQKDGLALEHQVPGKKRRKTLELGTSWISKTGDNFAHFFDK